MGESDFHWGNNVYLADGMYSVTVKVSGDTATFKDVNVSGGAAPGGAMSARGVTPTAPTTRPMTTTVGMSTTMPATGGTSSSNFVWLLALGGLGSLVLGLILLLRFAPMEI